MKQVALKPISGVKARKAEFLHEITYQIYPFMLEIQL